jgi:hypothetical protein
MDGSGFNSYKNKFNTSHDFPKDESHTLDEISKLTGYSKKGLQTIYNKGIGAYHTNPQSVRPRVKSPEQWAMARVYAAINPKSKANRVDKSHLFIGGTLKGVKKFERKIVNANSQEELDDLEKTVDDGLENKEYDETNINELQNKIEDQKKLLELKNKIIDKKQEFIPHQEIIEEVKVEIPEELLPKKKKKNKYVIDEDVKEKRMIKTNFIPEYLGEKYNDKGEQITDRERKLLNMQEALRNSLIRQQESRFKTFKNEAEDIYPLNKTKPEINRRILEESERRRVENTKYKLKKYNPDTDFGYGKILEQVVKNQFDENPPKDLLFPMGKLLMNDEHPNYKKEYNKKGEKQSNFLVFDASTDAEDIEFKHFDTKKYKKSPSDIKREGLTIQKAKFDNLRFRPIWTDDPKDPNKKMLYNIWDKQYGPWVNRASNNVSKNQNGKNVRVMVELDSDNGEENGGLYTLNLNDTDFKYNTNINNNMGPKDKLISKPSNRNFYWIDPKTLPNDPEKPLLNTLLKGDNLKKFKLKGYKKKNNI